MAAGLSPPSSRAVADAPSDMRGLFVDASPETRHRIATDYLLSTLPCVCDRCGHPMVGASARGRGGVRCAYYTCTTRAKRGSAACDQPRLSKDELEEANLAQMSEVHADTGLVAAALEDAAAAARLAQAGAREAHARGGRAAPQARALLRGVRGGGARRAARAVAPLRVAGPAGGDRGPAGRGAACGRRRAG